MAKEAWEKFRTKEPREERGFSAACYADKRMFVKEFTDMPKPMQEIFNVISLPCEGGGVPGWWCEQCVFGEIEEA